MASMSGCSEQPFSALRVEEPAKSKKEEQAIGVAEAAPTAKAETEEKPSPLGTGAHSSSETDKQSDQSKPKSATPQRRTLLAHCGAVPSYIWIALAVLVVMEVAAVTGSMYYARSVHNDQRRAAADVARTAARSIETVLDHLTAPMLSLANLVQLQPHWPTLNSSFPAFADAIYKTNPYYQIELCPYGVVGAMAFPWLNLTGEARWQFMLWFDMGLNIMDPTRPAFNVEIGAIISNGSVILLGPWYADGELSEGAFVVRYNVFLPPGNWEMPNNTIWACPHDVCNTPDGLTWWGWANAVFAWKTVSPKLKVLSDRGLLFTLSPDPRAANQSFLAMSDPLPNPDECEVVVMDVYGWMSWTFCVEPPGGFGPSWRAGLLVGVTALSVLLAVLVGLVLRSRHQAVRYLARQLELNKQLAVAKEDAEEGRRVIEAEKRVMDALVQRQRNLIELFGKEDELLASVEGKDGLGGGEEGSTAVAARRRLLGGSSENSFSRFSGLSRESATMDRIEAVRRQLSANRSPSMKNAIVNDVKLLEMLGEGTFGKVYRGVWRGTDVAVKTMVLPANMSGAEKREKMAIMEAAIASSLAHPNIVQTYTYFIKTVREEGSQEDSPADGILVGGQAGGTTVAASEAGGLNRTFDEPPSRASAAPNAQAVHGYEVRLVLEFCDRGCLRDALDGDAFLTSEGVNYRGVLDTAADIAKAMLHLHLADVLHGDLKARNVMLKSSGTEGRGVTCKVADFGLAVKMDTVEQTHMSGMYQGTLTHMAPELLLHGRMSKAADVYAYGITLWELFTGGHVFQGVPRALLGHQITQECKRPVFPPFVPAAYAKLADECWAHQPEERPPFEDILERLAAMRAELVGPAAPLAAYAVGAQEPVAAVAAPPQQAPLPKLSGGEAQIVTSNPIFEVGNNGGSGIRVGGSRTASGAGNSGTWFGRSGLRPQLAVVQEDDREHEHSHSHSSKKLPTVARNPTPHHLGAHPGAQPNGHGDGAAHGGGGAGAECEDAARGQAELEGSAGRLPSIEEVA